jgi:hypothetical protein
MCRDLREYQLPQKEYKLLQEVRSDPYLGWQASAALLNHLNGYENAFRYLIQGQETLIRQKAAAVGIALN